MSQRGHCFVRYADDILILLKSERAGLRVMENADKLLENRLKLTVNAVKSKVAKVAECNYLGFNFCRGKLRWTEQALTNFKHKIKQLTSRSAGISMEHRLRKLKQYVHGWMACYGT